MTSVAPPGSENVLAPDFPRVHLLMMMLIIGIERLLEAEAHPDPEDRMSTHTSRLTGKMILVDGGMTGHLEMIGRLGMIDHPGTTDHGMSDDDETAETIAAMTEIVAL